ncbi:MAG: MFS transporter [Bacteroidetes bacterium QH_10_64_19]|jgi:MFS family permease|nr:MAG: MFS transporter [Bacteroidetes bacterium QH_10_64_19]
MDPESSASTSLLGVDRRVLALAVARMADAVGNSFLIIVLPLYVASDAVGGSVFGIPASMVAGVVLALFGIASSIAQPLAGRLSDRMGRRKIFVIGGLVVLGAINLAFTVATVYWHLFVLRILQGLAAAFTITASLAIVNEMSDSGSRGGNMGIYNSFRLIGFGAGPILASILLEMGPFVLPGGMQITGFEATFGIAAGTAFLGTGLVGLLVQDPEATDAAPRRLAIRIWDRSGTGWKLDTIFALGLATLVMAACMALLSAIEPEVNARLGQGPFLFAVEFVALIAALAAVQPIVGRASDRLGRKPFILIGLLALIPTTLLQGLVQSPWQMIGMRVLQGVAGALVFAPALALAGDHTEEGQSGAQLAVLTVSFGLGISAGQLVAGFFVQFGFVVPFVVGSVCAAAGAVLVLTQVEASEQALSVRR